MRNIFLGLTLVGLLVFTYFFQELGTKQNELQSELKTTLISTNEMGTLLSINGPYFSLERKEDGRFYFINPNSSHMNVDVAKINKLFEVLGNLRIMRELTAEDLRGLATEEFVPADHTSIRFNFTDNFLVFTLGKKVETDQTFYVTFETKLGKKLLVVKDVSPLVGTYLQDTFHRNDEKYRRLASIFVLTDEFFQKMNVLNESQQNWLSVNILNIRKKDFKVYREPMKTFPEKYSGVNYKTEQFQEFFTQIEKMQAQDVMLKSSKENLDDFVSQLTITRSDKSQLYLSLYQKFRNEAGYFVVIDDGDKVYKVDNMSAKVFFTNVQQFWIKQPIELNSVQTLALGQEGEVFQLKRSAGKNIEYKVKAGKSITAHHRNIEKLLDFFNQESDRISLFDKFDKELYPKSLFNLKIGDRDYQVIKTEVELLLVDMENQLKYHFYTGHDIPFSTYLKDYILKRK